MSIQVILFKGKACPSCVQVEKIFNEIVGVVDGKVEARVVDISFETQLAIDNGVMGVPTIIIFKDNKEIKRITGTVTKEKLEMDIANGREKGEVRGERMEDREEAGN